MVCHQCWATLTNRFAPPPLPIPRPFSSRLAFPSPPHLHVFSHSLYRHFFDPDGESRVVVNSQHQEEREEYEKKFRQQVSAKHAFCASMEFVIC